MKSDFKKELMQAVTKGLEASAVADFLLPILARQKQKLIDSLCKVSPDYQKIDNSAYFALHLELRILSEFEDAVSSAVSRGEEASERLLADQRAESEKRSDEHLRM
jgi:hypothetical protein